MHEAKHTDKRNTHRQNLLHTYKQKTNKKDKTLEIKQTKSLDKILNTILKDKTNTGALLLNSSYFVTL